MNLKQLTHEERVVLIGGRALEATSFLHETTAKDITLAQIEVLRDKFARIIQLIDESEGHLQ